MRGKIISYKSYKKKEETKKEHNLHREVKRLDLLASHNPTDSVMKELLKTKHEPNNILKKKTEETLLKLRQQHFEFGNKTSKFLANQLKQQTEKSIITSIVDSSGNITHDPSTINDSFRTFYSNLYTPTQNTSPVDTEIFLRNVSLPK